MNIPNVRLLLEPDKTVGKREKFIANSNINLQKSSLFSDLDKSAWHFDLSAVLTGACHGWPSENLSFLIEKR
jgi:hypothetical protein